MKNGFTLIELSIGLVIVALFIGGFVTGKTDALSDRSARG